MHTSAYWLNRPNPVFRKKQGKKQQKISSSGYILVPVPLGFPGSRRGWIHEHRLIAAKAMGKPVPSRCPVHHVNEDRTDNRPENLVVCNDGAYHNLLHHRARVLRKCGDANKAHWGWKERAAESLRAKGYDV